MMATKETRGVALITGAAGGIGRDTAFSFAEAGASGVVLADKNIEGTQETAEKFQTIASCKGFRAVAVSVEVTDASSVQAMVDRAIKEFGRIDYSIHCAGDSSNPILDASEEEFTKVIDINAKGTMLCIRAVSQAMSKQEPQSIEGRNGTRSIGRGSIINLASSLGQTAFPGLLTYTASKHAVLGITKTAALDCLPYGIRVNAVCPSWVDTPMMAHDFSKEPELKDAVNKAAPLGRMAQADEVSEYIVFLSSPAASYINGTALIIDGGLTLSMNLS